MSNKGVSNMGVNKGGSSRGVHSHAGDIGSYFVYWSTGRDCCSGMN